MKKSHNALRYINGEHLIETDINLQQQLSEAFYQTWEAGQAAAKTVAENLPEASCCGALLSDPKRAVEPLSALLAVARGNSELAAALHRCPPREVRRRFRR